MHAPDPKCLSCPWNCAVLSTPGGLQSTTSILSIWLRSPGCTHSRPCSGARWRQWMASGHVQCSVYKPTWAALTNSLSCWRTSAACHYKRKCGRECKVSGRPLTLSSNSDRASLQRPHVRHTKTSMRLVRPYFRVGRSGEHLLLVRQTGEPAVQ